MPTLEERVAHLETEVAGLRQRNSKVEKDKAWEMSWVRILIIAAVTYIAVVLLLQILQTAYAWLAALIPAGGYFTSSLTLPKIKKYWLEIQKHRKKFG